MSKRKKQPTPRKPWEPLHFSHFSDQGAEIWGNGKYTVTKHELRQDWETDDDAPTMMVLGIHTRTRSTVGAHDWRHFQRIKNEMAGPEREAVEIYPPESQLVDSANEYWLWVLPEGESLNFGFRDGRVVQDAHEQPHTVGWTQRKLDPDTAERSHPQ